MLDIPPNIDRFCRIVIERKTALKLCQRIRKIRRPKDDPVFPQVVLIPWKRIIIKRISPIEILCCICIKQMIEKQDVIHVLFIKNRQVMRFFLVRKQIPYWVKCLRPPAYVRDHKEL